MNEQKDDDQPQQTEYVTRTTQFIVAPQGHNTFSEDATTITITDDAGGEFVVVEQNTADYGKIAINPEEWPALRAAINRMVKECRNEPQD